MNMDWAMALLGGLMIGGAASLFLLTCGKVMGVSDMFGGLVDGSGWSTAVDRLAFLGGLVVVPGLLALFVPGVSTHVTDNWPLIVVAGLLVGVGTRLANGCTSGHGVCGISRLSRRGIVATVLYILAGAVTMALARHVLEAI